MVQRIENALDLKEFLKQYTKEELESMKVYIGKGQYEDVANLVEYDGQDIVIDVI